MQQPVLVCEELPIHFEMRENDDVSIILDPFADYECPHFPFWPRLTYLYCISLQTSAAERTSSMQSIQSKPIEFPEIDPHLMTKWAIRSGDNPPGDRASDVVVLLVGKWSTIEIIIEVIIEWWVFAVLSIGTDDARRRCWWTSYWWEIQITGQWWLYEWLCNLSVLSLSLMIGSLSVLFFCFDEDDDGSDPIASWLKCSIASFKSYFHQMSSYISPLVQAAQCRNLVTTVGKSEALSHCLRWQFSSSSLMRHWLWMAN